MAKKRAKSKKISKIKNKGISIPIPQKQIKTKTYTAVREIILFAILFGVFLLLYRISPKIGFFSNFPASSQELYLNLFWILALITGFALLAFVIAWLVLIIVRATKR